MHGGGRFWGRSAPAGVAFLIVASPYVVFLHSVTGRWAFSGKQGISIDIAWAFVNHDQRAHDRAVARLDAAGKEINAHPTRANTIVG